MIDKIKDLDRKLVAVIVVVLLLVVSFAFVDDDNGDDQANNQEVSVQQEEAQTSEPAEETAPATDAEEPQAEAETTEESAAEEPASDEPAAEEPQQEQTAATGTYQYVAQPGDSYTEIARKAVQTYGIINDVSLSEAQIVAAETKLTQAAGEPLLEIGQQVTIDESAVEDAVSQVQELDEATLALWATYVPSVDFDTDAVGEPRQ